MRKNPFHNFIRTERHRYKERDNNRLTFSASHASRYYNYVSIILERYAIADNAYREERRRIHNLSESQPNGFPPEELNRSVQLKCELHLEIESFYVFAKTLLDKTAHLVELYFGDAQNCSLNSHHKFLTCSQTYFKIKKLKDTDKIVSLMTQLQCDIVHFRDKKLTRQNNSRVSLGTAFPEKQGAFISAGHFYPKPSDQPYESQPLDSLIDDIDEYLNNLLTWMIGNRERSNLQIKE